MEIFGVEIDIEIKDLYVISGFGFLMSIFANFAAISRLVKAAQEVLVIFSVFLIFIGFYFVLKVKRSWGGYLGRFLETQLVAFFFLTLMWILSLYNNFKISFMGLNQAYWSSFMYATGFAGFITAVYSFYLLNEL